jgi:hypothetical protein
MRRGGSSNSVRSYKSRVISSRTPSLLRGVFWWCDETGSLECTSNWHGQTGSFSHCFYSHPDLFTTGLFKSQMETIGRENQSEETILFFVCVLAWIIVSELVLFFFSCWWRFLFWLISPLRIVESPVPNSITRWPLQSFLVSIILYRLTPFQKGDKGIPGG